MGILKADTDTGLKSDKLGLMEKVSFGFGDLASNFVWGMISSYLLFFYTNVFGIAAAATGTLFLITRVLDAVIDPFFGILIDHTKSKHGKARPYLLYLAIPLGVISILAFITPNFSPDAKLVYAYVTFLLLGIVYSGINVPYGALLAMMTRNSYEKTQLGGFRMMGLGLGSTLVAACTMPLVNFFGNGNQKIGFPVTMAVYSIIGVILFLLVFKNCKERYSGHSVHEDKGTIGKSLINMLKNQPWLMIAIGSIIQFLRIGVVFSVLIYYAMYVLKQPAMGPVLLTLSNGGSFIGGAIASPILKRLGNRNGSIIVLSATTLLFVLLIFLEKQPILFAVILFIAFILIGVSGAAIYAMLADTADYQEWKFGRRTEGLLYSVYSFATKFGIAIGSAFAAYALGWAGYDPKAITGTAINAIRVLLYAGAILFTVGQIITLIFYKLDKHHAQIVKELNERVL
ncbi:MFS transporter [Scopulibacillus cellulosilyticus]|uniref:MFS transporter n=1 Tax=Scopulibacillus cellulosilyticus TaxID=2665665 RepID=A0ABW2PQN6_9BACL